MKKIVKRIGVVLLLSNILVSPVFAKDINIYINNEKIETADAPFVKNERTLVPIRVISENLGVKVDWNQEKQEVSLEKEGNEIFLPLKEKYYVQNGERVATDIAPEIKNNRTFVPLRLIAELYGKEVRWDQESYSVWIQDSGQGKLKEKLNQQKEELIQQKEKPQEKKKALGNRGEKAYLYANGRIIGNKNSSIYHLPTNRDYKKVSLRNAVFFNTEKEAKAAGFRPAKR